MDIYKIIFDTLKQDQRRGFTSFDIMRAMSNTSDGRNEIGRLRARKIKGRDPSEKDVMTSFENNYRYMVATALNQFAIKGYVTKEGQSYKITELGLKKSKELNEIF